MNKHRIFLDRYGLLMLLDLAACCLYGIFFLAHPPIMNFPLPDHPNLILWHEFLIYRYRWPLVGIGIALSFLAIAGYYVHKSPLRGRRPRLQLRHPDIATSSVAARPAGCGVNAELAPPKAGGGRFSAESYSAKLLHYLMPLSLLPWASVILLLWDILPQEIISNSVLFIPVLLFSLIVAGLLEVFIAKGNGRENRSEASPCQGMGHPDREGASGWRNSAEADNPASLRLRRGRLAIPPRCKPRGILAKAREWTLMIFILSTVFYAWLGYHIAEVTGEHVGDEGHYLMQARSLYHDHDLDVKNNFMEKIEEEERSKLAQRRLYLHISPNSRGDHWYSWHSYGLPLILAPVFGLGRLARYLVLGMIAALGNVDMYKVSRGVDAGRNASLAMVLGFGSSVYWGLYSARALPEVLGATLLCWLFWAILFQEKRPWSAVCVGSFCCSYLPMAHHRFLLLGLMGIAFYALAALCSGERWGRRIFRAAIFSLLCLFGLGIFFATQYSMYERGMIYEIGGVVQWYPLGIWGIIADSRGLVSIMPSFMWLSASLVGWIISSPRSRLFATSILITFVICLLVSCSNRWYVGGSCVPGRYIMAVVPLLIPGAAYMLQRTTSVGRWWFFFLSAVSTSFLIMVLLLLPVIGRGFVLPIHSLSNSHPILSSLYHPHASFIYESTRVSRFVTSTYVAAGIISTTLILFVPEKKRRYSILLILLIGVLGAWGHVVQPWRSRFSFHDPQRLAKNLSRLNLERIYVATKMNKPTSLFDISKYTLRDSSTSDSVAGVTTRDLGVRTDEQLISQPNLEVNDWEGRGYRWTTLTAPCSPTRGWRVLHIEGVMKGPPRPVFALREGAETIYEGALNIIDHKIDENIAFYSYGGRGHLYILLRLEEGEGSFYLKELYWSPYSDNLLKKTNLYIPGKLSIVDRVK